jgi:hypothetical protein
VESLLSEYRIIVLRAGGELHPVPVKEPGLDAVCRQVIRFAQNAAVHGCPLGDALPPVWVEVRDGEDRVVIRIHIDPTLKPVDEIAP